MQNDNQNPNMNMQNQNPNMNMYNQNPNMNMYNQNPNMSNTNYVNGNSTDKTFGYLSYIGILCLIPFFTKKDDKVVSYHAKQGLALFISAIVIVIVTSLLVNLVINNIFTTEVTYWGISTGERVPSGFALFLGTILGWLAPLYITILSIIGLMNVSKNVTKPLPIIGKFVEQK